MNPPKVKPRAVCAVIASILVLSVSPAGLAEGPLLTLEEIVKNMAAVNSSLNSFRVDQVIDVRFWFFQFRLASTVYAARPARYRVVVDDPPWFLRPLGTIFTHVGRPEDVIALYAPRQIAWREDGGRRLLYLDLVNGQNEVNPPKGEMYVDPKRWLAEKMILHYDWGDVCAEFKYGQVEEFLLPATITVRVPGFAISAVASYRNYQLNVPIPDSAFEDK